MPGQNNSIDSTRPVALITGASSGIGEGFARGLAADGYDLVLVARRLDRLEAIAKELREKHRVAVECLRADLKSATELATVEKRIADCDRLELLVNNAGFMKPMKFADADVEAWDAMVRLHNLATIRLTHAAIPGMVSRMKNVERPSGAILPPHPDPLPPVGGRGDKEAVALPGLRGRGERGASAPPTCGIINVSSIAAFMPVRNNVVYSATKQFLVLFTEGLMQELRGTGVAVQALCPGWTTSELILEREGVDTSNIKGRWWTPTELVVNHSLKKLKRGKLVVIPGWRYRLMVLGIKLTERPVLRWLMRVMNMNQVKMKEE